ncbi:L-lactate dehydrogenase [Spiroplasma endosymbiont of Anurida maritima]|uniref:L-lactate dehydrogenase n=1 Tax=Spiroplasma endosymbiont of Anurida maritima TaxID=2967972 RepID=UPI0036D426BA
MKNHKIALIGAGAVGTSFLYAAINQGLAQDYILIDKFEDAAEGNALDLADTMANLPLPFNSIQKGDYKDLKDVDIIVITAGRPQKPGETRLEMVADNAKIMKEIALNIKKSGFDGITIVASNPVDVLTNVYQEVTKFEPNKVISSGTLLDSGRLMRLLADKFNVNPNTINAWILGEHGDSSVPVWSMSNIMGKTIKQYMLENRVTQKELDTMAYDAIHMAYKIIEKKRSTFYGIGVSLAKIVRAILRNENSTLIIGAQLNHEYGGKYKGLYVGVPAVVNSHGWTKIIEWNITDDEQKKFEISCEKLLEVVKVAKAAIK